MRSQPYVRHLAMLATAMVMAIPAFAHSPPLTIVAGIATVIDGDTIKLDEFGVNTLTIRLAGIDAPEIDQRCTTKNQTTLDICGVASRIALDSMIYKDFKRALKKEVAEIAEGFVRCILVGKNQSNQHIGMCFNAIGWPLGKTMVRNGYALNYPIYLPDYSDDEAHAKSENRGIHGTTFVPPWEWREGKRVSGK